MNRFAEPFGLARFKLVKDVPEAGFIELERPIREILKAQPGFIDRALAKGEDGQFLVTLTWSSRLNGAAWTEASRGFEVLVRQHGMIDFSTMRMEFFETIL